MAISISYRAATTLPTDFTGLTPEWAQGKSLAEIEERVVLHGRRQVALAELCQVSGATSDGRLEFNGDFSHAHGIGAGMTAGGIRVDGDAGRNVGLGMRGGEIHITGDASDSLGSEMSGGIIRVDGSAGNSVGGARSGSRRGMTGGTILVTGSVGAQTGHRMRRGLIASGGSAGELLGHNMFAGTIVVLGDCGPRAGAGMKRGTLCLLGKMHPPPLPTFRSAGKLESPVLPLTGRHLQSLGFIEDTAAFQEPCELVHGDFLALGKGEMLLAS